MSDNTGGGPEYPTGQPGQQQPWTGSGYGSNGPQQYPQQYQQHYPQQYQQQYPSQPMPGSLAGRPVRPGVTTAAAVLGFVQAGLGVLGVFIVFGSLDEVRIVVGDGVANLLTVLVFVQIASCALLIYGGVALLRGSTRAPFVAGVGLYFALTLASVLITLTADGYRQQPLGFIGLIMPALGLSFALSRGTTEYLNSRR